jgi:Bacterial EndoU nuclease
MFMKLKHTTRHLNFYFLKIHILRLLFCVYIVGMAGFVLASRRNDGQEINKKSLSNEMKDLLCTFFAHADMKKLNNHTSRYHCGKGEEVLDNGVGRRWANNGDYKTLFPEEWTEDKTVEAIKSVLVNPKKLYRDTSTKNGVPTLVAEGKFKDVSIRVIIARKGSKSNVITAFPLIDENLYYEDEDEDDYYEDEDEDDYYYASKAGKGE